jgi:hypothetical protein
LPPSIETRADDLPVINDSEALQYVGKAVEVRGFFHPVPISPLGAAFINLGREYPTQTFAGFMPAPKKALALVARRTIVSLMATFSLILTASHSHAGLGWTLAQLKQEYGKHVLSQERIAGRIGHVFTGEDYVIAAFFLNKQVSRIMYICRSGSVFSWGRARALLGANAPDAIWADASKMRLITGIKVCDMKNLAAGRCFRTRRRGKGRKSVTPPRLGIDASVCTAQGRLTRIFIGTKSGHGADCTRDVSRLLFSHEAMDHPMRPTLKEGWYDISAQFFYSN